MLRDAEQQTRAALEEAKAMLAEATREAARLKDQAAKDTAALLERRAPQRGREDRPGRSRRDRRGPAIAVDVAIAATRQVLTDQVQGALADRMIDHAIAELPRRLS